MSHFIVMTFLQKNCEQNYIYGESDTVNPRYYAATYNVNWYHGTIQCWSQSTQLPEENEISKSFQV
jgi:hypothetical protein